MDLALMFGGVVVSLLAEFVSRIYGPNKYAMLTLVVILSIVFSGGFYALQHYGLWTSFVQVVTTAGAVYAFIIRNFFPGLPPMPDVTQVNTQNNVTTTTGG